MFLSGGLKWNLWSDFFYAYPFYSRAAVFVIPVCRKVEGAVFNLSFVDVVLPFFFYFVDRQACEKKILSNLLMPFSELSLRPGESHLSCFNCLCLCERCIEEAKMVTSLYFILFF